MTIYAADLMCGIGGATRGFLDAGIKVLKGVDIDESCKKTYEENNKPAQFLSRDICKLTKRELLEGFELNQNCDKFALIVCAPCQPFSRAGLKKPKNSKRLVTAIANLICEIKPDYVFAENVPGFQKYYPAIYKEFLRPYSQLGYNYQCKVVNLKKFGVPQSRSRYVFLASRDSVVDLPNQTHGPENGLLPYVTVRNVIEKYPALLHGGTNPAFNNHVCPSLSKLNQERLEHTPKDGGSRGSWPKNLWLKCHMNTKGHSDVYGRMHWDSVAPTMTCRCISISNGRFVHPSQNRGISLREAAALQTFKDNFVFYEPMSKASKHVGNGVPPLVACIFGKKILENAARNSNEKCVPSAMLHSEVLIAELAQSQKSMVKN